MSGLLRLVVTVGSSFFEVWCFNSEESMLSINLFIVMYCVMVVGQEISYANESNHCFQSNYAIRFLYKYVFVIYINSHNIHHMCQTSQYYFT